MLFAPSLDAIPSSSLLPPPPLVSPREVCISPRSSFSEATPTTSPTSSSFFWSTTTTSSSTRTSFSEEPPAQATTFPRRRTSTRLPPSPSIVRPPLRRHQSLPSTKRSASTGPPTPTSFLHDPPTCPIPPSLLKSPLLTSERSPFHRRATLSAGPGGALGLVAGRGGEGGGDHGRKVGGEAETKGSRVAGGRKGVGGSL